MPRPETLREARLWDQTRGHYFQFGLCNRCAAQAAWGHADGFRRIAPPCGSCSGIVTQLPIPRVNEWRSFRRGQDGTKTPVQGPQTPLA